MDLPVIPAAILASDGRVAVKVRPASLDLPEMRIHTREEAADDGVDESPDDDNGAERIWTVAVHALNAG